MPKTQTTKPKYVLIMEENVHHAELLTEVLDRHFAPVIIHTVDTFSDGMDFLQQTSYDLVLSAAFIGNEEILSNVKELVSSVSGAPLIVITGRGDERLAARLTKRGISEYVVKSRDTLDKLPAIIKKHLKKSSKKKRSGTYPTPTPSDEQLAKNQDIMGKLNELKNSLVTLTKASLTKSGKIPDIKKIDELKESIEQIRNMYNSQ